jgi:hypothetical protein
MPHHTTGHNNFKKGFTSKPDESHCSHNLEYCDTTGYLLLIQLTEFWKTTCIRTFYTYGKAILKMKFTQNMSSVNINKPLLYKYLPFCLISFLQCFVIFYYKVSNSKSNLDPSVLSIQNTYRCSGTYASASSSKVVPV